MKKTILSIKMAAAVALALSFSQCEKDAPSNPVYPPYPETSLDATAGTWKTYILANGQEIPVPAPETVSSSAYQSELAELKSIMAAATAEQKERAQWWGGNATLRWHEIARELAADYNVPPNYDAEGKYPAPDPNNPSAYPRFPFADPTYAARAFALLAVAQYDALVTCWDAKMKYNRLAPYKNDGSIQPLIPANDLPSYPSEDAVLAAAAREVLKFLFPGEIAQLDALAEEHKNSRLWAGANVRSDLSAGDSLGRIVGQRIISYAKTDRMDQANNQAAYPNMVADATARGMKQIWTSREIPARPPLRPFFGNVKTWNFDDATKIALRPPVPPQPGSEAFENDMEELRKLAKNRTREQFRIAAYWADGPGTYTPPGHWNRKAAELIYDAQMNEIRSARAMALVTSAIHDAGVTCWDVKYFYLLPRPSEIDAKVTTSTGIPNFPAYTSGHSTFSGAGAQVLAYLFPGNAAELQAMAKEASESRIYGCIHYRFDCEVGLEVGRNVGNYAIERGRNDGSQ
jgi:hypothetical protein